MSEVAIKVENVSKIYKIYNKPIDRLKEALSLSKKKRHRDFYALQDVSFEIKKGETLGIIGVNGSGKSTLLKVITGVLNQSSGNVLVNGKIAALLELGAGFNPEYTGMENIYLNGTMMGYSKEEMDDRVPFITEFADIGEFVNQPVKTYSSGMYVRLAFAVAINVEPEILIVDEALSVGDVFFQLKCFKRFEKLKEEGTTILFVTHSLDTVIRYCDRAILLGNGTMLMDGNTKTVVDEYKKKIIKDNHEINPKEEVNTKIESNVKMQTLMSINPEFIEYGNKKAIIKDFGIFSEDGEPLQTMSRGVVFKVIMVVEFIESVTNPIFAMTIKDIKGTEIAGTNTMYVNVNTDECHTGDIREISFKQVNNLQSGVHFFSLGCTGFDRSSNFEVYHRLYDIMSIETLSEKLTVGFFDLNSDISIVDRN